MNKSKVFMIFGILLLVVTIIGTTFAYYIWTSSSENETKIVTNVGSATVYFDGGKIIENASLRPVESKEYGIVKNISVQANKAGINFDLYLDITSIDDNLKDKSFRYQFYKEDTLVKEGNFSSDYLNNNLVNCSVNNTNHIVLLSNENVSTTKLNYSLYIWVDGLQDNPKEMMGKSFSFLLHAEGTGALLKEGVIPDITELPESQKKTFAYKILSDYYYADKSDISNNGITYHYDVEHNLMSDVGGNVRYYGANPNNYIYFNCDDYSNQTDTTCEKWRIIGVFDGKVKIMRSQSIGTYSWDNKNLTTGAETDRGKNDWSTARLMKLLNPSDYYEIDSNDNGNGQSLYWNSESGTCFAGQNNATKSCDFTSKGLKNDTTRDIILETMWYLRSSSTDYSDVAYENERTSGKITTNRLKIWSGKIALPYPSDYGYAADFSQCTQKLSSYNDSTCTANNWMKPILNVSVGGWLLSPSSEGYSYLFRCEPSVNNVGQAYGTLNIIPTLHLNYVIEVDSGDGSSSSPYQIKVS